jgi:hypothetical protein
MLPVSLDCPFSLPLRYSLTFICPVSCVPNIASFSGLSFCITPSVFSNIYLSCVLCTLCCQFIWIIFFFITPWVFSNIYLSCVLCILCCQFIWIIFFFITPWVFSNIYLSCVLRTIFCQFIWIIFFLLPLGYSLTCICPVSCVPYVASFSGLSFFITPSVFFNIYLSCVLCTQCCQFLWIVLFYYPLGIL